MTWTSGPCLPLPRRNPTWRLVQAEAIRWRNAALWGLALWLATRWGGWILFILAACSLASTWCGIYWIHIRDA